METDTCFAQVVVRRLLSLDRTGIISSRLDGVAAFFAAGLATGLVLTSLARGLAFVDVGCSFALAFAAFFSARASAASAQPPRRPLIQQIAFSRRCGDHWGRGISAGIQTRDS